MHVTGVDRLLWILSFVGHCALLATLILRRRVRYLPVFTGFVAMNIVRTFGLYILLYFGSDDQYFYVYWSLAILDVGLQLALAYELASHVFKPIRLPDPDVQRSVIGIATASMSVAVFLTWLAVPPTRTLRLAIVLRGNFFASVLLSELFVGILAFSVVFSLPWRTHAASVLHGIGSFSLVGLLSDAAHNFVGTQKGPEAFNHITQLQNGFYLMCLAYWTVTLAKDEPAPQRLPDELHNEIRMLQTRVTLMLRSLRTIGSHL